MKKVILDTNFIMTCVKQKIDFQEWFFLNALKPIIPVQVFRELERISTSKQKQHNKEIAKISLKILENLEFESVDLNLRYADKGIKKLAQKEPKLIVATLDKELKEKINNPKLVIRNKKKLELI